jgi:hypothetical protein
VHFRCRLCGRVYDLDIETTKCLNKKVEGHEVEAVRTYAFGVCASCRRESDVAGEPSQDKKNAASPKVSGRGKNLAGAS